MFDQRSIAYVIEHRRGELDRLIVQLERWLGQHQERVERWRRWLVTWQEAEQND